MALPPSLKVDPEQLVRAVERHSKRFALGEAREDVRQDALVILMRPGFMARLGVAWQRTGLPLVEYLALCATRNAVRNWRRRFERRTLFGALGSSLVADHRGSRAAELRIMLREVDEVLDQCTPIAKERFLRDVLGDEIDDTDHSDDGGTPHGDEG